MGDIASAGNPDFAIVGGANDSPATLAYLTKAAGLSLEAANAAQRLKVEAEWQAGALLRELDLSATRRTGSTLEPLGLEKHQSHRWLDCWEQKEIAEAIGVSEGTISGWFKERKTAESEPPESRQHFDVWQFKFNRHASSWPAASTP